MKRVKFQEPPQQSHRHHSHSCSLMNKLRLYKWRYSSFINSPRVCFIYDTFFYTIFLLLFSYMLLCRFVYYEDELNRDNDDEAPKSHLLAATNRSISNSSGLLRNRSLSEPADDELREVTKPTRLEYTLMVWVFIYLIEEVKQVVLNHIWEIFLSKTNNTVFFF